MKNNFSQLVLRDRRNDLHPALSYWLNDKGEFIGPLQESHVNYIINTHPGYGFQDLVRIFNTLKLIRINIIDHVCYWSMGLETPSVVQLEAMENFAKENHYNLEHL